MNLAHFRAFLWLRWRLLVNQWRRGGRLNVALMMICGTAAICLAIPLFVGSVWLGMFAIPLAEPVLLLAVWDLLLVPFLFFWSAGLLTELQRSEPLVLSKFLHLPVSAGEAFVINYVSSLLTLSLIIFTPIFLGYSVALIITKGLIMLPSMAGVGAFLLMVTAVTYQLRGWLAALMSNPRRRRTVVVVATTLFILIAQLPNLINILAPWNDRKATAKGDLQVEMERIARELEKSADPGADQVTRQREMEDRLKTQREQKTAAEIAYWTRAARLSHMLIPIGWLPLGVMSAAEGNVLPSLLGLAGMALIGVGSLRSAYRGTVRLYQGEPTNQKRREKIERPAGGIEPSARPRSLLVEAKIPGFSEQVSAIATATLRSLACSPESKMLLLSSTFMIILFASMTFRSSADLSSWFRPLMAIGTMGVVLLSTSNFLANQFGFDRDGFRVYVLNAVPRRDILLAKNLAYAPLIFIPALILLVIVQTLRPLRMDHLAAMIPQFITMFLLYCILTNMLSIFAPVYLPSGSLRPSNPTATTILLQLVTVMILLPMVESLTLIPLGTEFILELLGQQTSLPVCLILTLVQCALVVLLYVLAIHWQGRLLQEREQTVLERVTSRVS